jgi:hypothetical protein
MEAPAEPLTQRGWDFARPCSFNFVDLEDPERSLEIQPFALTAVPPAWDDDIFVATTFADSKIYGWDPAALETRLLSLRGEPSGDYEKSKFPGGPDHGSVQLKDNAFRKPASQPGAKWGPLDLVVRSIAVTRDAVLLAVASDTPPVPGPAGRPSENGAKPDAPKKAPTRPSLRAVGKNDGKTLWERELPAQPAADALTVDRTGRIIIGLETGGAVCFGAAR